jgi:hypothetical protein
MSLSEFYDYEHNIYINGFWPGFVNKTDANNIGFFENLFQKTKLKNYVFTNDIIKADVLFESVFNTSMTNAKKWKLKIHYSGEPFCNNKNNYDIVLYSEQDNNNVVNLPLAVYYIYQNNFLSRLMHKKIITKIPNKFCCFIVSNGKCEVRNIMFKKLNLYKKVDSYGKFNNNMNCVLNYDYWTENYLNFLSQYKFIICFENSKLGTYHTEKIVNPFLARIIPIYWSTSHVKNIFNENSMLFLENDDEASYTNLINKIIEVDNNDELYLKYVNELSFLVEYWNQNYTIDKIAKNIDKLLP